MRKVGGRLVAIDFAKAFDSVEHDFLFHTLDKMGLGGNFLHMISTLLKGANSAVMNNGKTSHYFPLQRSCRQGDCVSPLLFNLALEPLLRKLKEVIKGIKTAGGWAKIAAYADDLTIFLSKEDDLNEIIKILNTFGSASGLKINIEKSECISFDVDPNRVGLKEPSTLCVTGVHHAKSKGKALEEANFEEAIQKMQKSSICGK